MQQTARCVNPLLGKLKLRWRINKRKRDADARFKFRREGEEEVEVEEDARSDQSVQSWTSNQMELALSYCTSSRYVGAISEVVKL